MSRKDAVLLASRTLSLLFIVSALVEGSYLPGRVHSFLHYLNHESASSANQYWRHYYLIEVGFLLTRIVGFSLVAIWLRRCSLEVEEMLLPGSDEDIIRQ